MPAGLGLEGARWTGHVGVQLRLDGFVGPQWGPDAMLDRLSYGATLSLGVCAGW